MRQQPDRRRARVITALSVSIGMVAACSGATSTSTTTEGDRVGGTEPVPELCEFLTLTGPQLGLPTAVVFLQPDVSDADRDRIGSLLEEHFEAVRYIDETAAAQQFDELFSGDPRSARVFEPFDRSELPTSFEISDDSGADVSPLNIDDDPAVFDILRVGSERVTGPLATGLTAPWSSRSSDELIFVHAGSSAEAVEEIGVAIEALPTTDVRYVGIDETFAEFQELFGDDPDLRTVEPDVLPTSFRLLLADPLTAGERSRIASLDEVYELTRFPSRRLEARARGSTAVALGVEAPEEVSSLVAILIDANQQLFAALEDGETIGSAFSPQALNELVATANQLRDVAWRRCEIDAFVPE